LTTLERCHADLKLIMEAVEIHSPTQYSVFGELRDYSNQPPAASVSQTSEPTGTLPAEGAILQTLVFQPFLENDLYSRLYVRPTLGPTAAYNPLAQRDHISALSAANDGTGTWEPGWRVNSLGDDGRVCVSKDQVAFWVLPAGLRTTTGKIRVGDFCRVRIAKEMRQLMPGFYFAFGNGSQQDTRDTSDPLIRFYWHLTADAAVPYMSLATTLFNQAGLPFRTKVLSDPTHYVRADAGVLYLERRYFGPARNIIREIHERTMSGLRQEVPMFTKALAEGLGLAEDPNNQMSFGQSRCKIAARTLCSCFVRGVSDPEERLSLLMKAFEEEGLDPASPYLDKNSIDFYSLTGEFPPTSQFTRVTRRHGKHKKNRTKRYKGVSA
jgi:hypothetical protein